MVRLSKWLLAVLAIAILLGFSTAVLAAETKGKIKSVSADKKEFVMTDENAKDWTFQLDTGGKVQLNNQDRKLDDLKVGDEVRITYEKKDNKLIASEVRAERK
jgi:hypothetical protein